MLEMYCRQWGKILPGNTLGASLTFSVRGRTRSQGLIRPVCLVQELGDSAAYVPNIGGPFLTSKTKGEVHMFESEHVRAAQAQPRRGGAGRRWSALLSGLAFGVAGTLFFSSVASAAGLDSYPTEPTEAEASIAAMTLGGNDIIGLAESHAGSVSNVGPNREAFSGSLGGTEIVDFGS
jgi:hypothetical protein